MGRCSRRRSRRTFPGSETGHVPFRRRPRRRRSRRRACRVERGDVPRRTGQGPTRVSSYPKTVADDPAPRFPPPAHRRCSHLGDRARGQPVENAPCQARHRVASRSRERSGSAAFDPLLHPLRVFHASSTATVPDKPEARWAKGGKRNSALIGAMFPSTARRTFGSIETGDVSVSRSGQARASGLRHIAN